jgi:hypothetical protein
VEMSESDVIAQLRAVKEAKLQAQAEAQADSTASAVALPQSASSGVALPPNWSPAKAADGRCEFPQAAVPWLD